MEGIKGPVLVTFEENYSLYSNVHFYYLAPGVEGGGPHVLCLFGAFSFGECDPGK